MNHCHRLPKQFLTTVKWAHPIFSNRKLVLLGSRSLSNHANFKPPVLVSADGNALEVDKVSVLKQKMEHHGINYDFSCVPGKFSLLLCPQCKGGKSMERSLSLHIIQDAEFAMWRCYRTSCGWAGQAFADDRLTIEGMNIIFKVRSSGPMTPEGIVLEPLCEKLIAYFSDRRISKETLQRNYVMQMAGDQDIIAFTYRRNGVLVGCKFRTTEKRFWQEKGTAKWLYGIDDICDASEIIIVEGEIDKLSLEEAGFCNCVSVPGGAPQAVSTKELPPSENDKAYQYLWNCKDYLDKVSRIILATDGDVSGRALAEELARRLGKERCWIVRWPKKDHSHYFKDANEVLECLGPTALKEVIETAELYQSHIMNQAV
ncbi:primase homolog protein [Mercurialis annua]|uniref:primase homolog protein n=1 Tax=Mercurialis annua TaxID=3986 RepID=UPI00215E72C5|nr:primase homolog protein [Mercurialis annua]